MADSKQSSPGGILVGHDWSKFACERHLIQKQTKFDAPVTTKHGGFVTDYISIDSKAQIVSFDTAKRIVGPERIKCIACPLELLGSSLKPCDTVQKKTAKAFAKFVYPATKEKDFKQTFSLTKAAKDNLDEIEHAVLQNNTVDISAKTVEFLSHYGSHVITGGGSHDGPYFEWMILVEGDCNFDLLQELAHDVFAKCQKEDLLYQGSEDGIAYKLQDVYQGQPLLKKELQETVQQAVLRVSQIGVKKNSSFTKWTNHVITMQGNIMSETPCEFIPVWDIIQRNKEDFKNAFGLGAALENAWERLVRLSQHTEIKYLPAIKDVKYQNYFNWMKLTQNMELNDFFPSMLTTQRARTIQKRQSVKELADIPWTVLEQLILLDHTCRERILAEFVEAARKQSQTTRKKFGQNTRGANLNSSLVDKQPLIPHPMDLMLLIFVCSDYMLRQLLAQKLFMCRLALPFLIPAAEGNIEMLLWPLRSIIMEWRDGNNKAMEESLVQQELCTVSWVRLGETSSKSKLINEIISATAHPSFFHREATLGKQKRLISNGMVELTHYLPSGTESDHFKQPALFFNLRGDACQFPQQHDILKRMTSTSVILVDIGDFDNDEVSCALKRLNPRTVDIVFILTDKNGSTEEQIGTCQDKFAAYFGDNMESIEIVTMFELDGEPKNSSEVVKELRDIIGQKMKTGKVTSIEQMAKDMTGQCAIDEDVEPDCVEGKKTAKSLIKIMEKVKVEERKAKLLPRQGNCLGEIGGLLRSLHRQSLKTKNGDFLEEKEYTRKKIKEIRDLQAQSQRPTAITFMEHLSSIFRTTGLHRSFTMRWIQLELDNVSRTVLPTLHKEKNRKWEALMAGKQDQNLDKLPDLTREVKAAEKKITETTLGYEHLMREVGQVYEVAVNKQETSLPTHMFDLQVPPDVVASQLLDGVPMELLDGDHGFLPLCWVKAVFQSLSKLVGKDKKIYVLSVLGIQSSGKSTLLNAMFGLEFAVSAGRCTRGIYAQLLPVSSGETRLPFDYLLVLDSEGLRAQELGEHNFEHDNELATLVIGLADLALINLKGENAGEMTDVLQIVVHAFMRMKIADSLQHRQCMFLHQNVSAVNAQEKLAHSQQKLQEHLDEMTRGAAEAHGVGQTFSTFSKVIAFDGKKHVKYFSDLWHGDPPMATINQGYSCRVADTKTKILDEIFNVSGCITVADFISRIEDMWKGILSDDFVFSFRNSVAAKAFISLEREFRRLTMVVESELLDWQNKHCRHQIQLCLTVEALDDKCSQLKQEMLQKNGEEIGAKLQILEGIFENSINKDIVCQWKAEKMASFQLFGQTLIQDAEREIRNMHCRRVFEIHQESNANRLEEEILKKALSLADQLRGKAPSDYKLKKAFDDLWKEWYQGLKSGAEEGRTVVLSTLQEVMIKRFQEEGQFMYLQEQLEQTPLKPAISNVISIPVQKTHVLVKDTSLLGKLLAKTPSKSDCLLDVKHISKGVVEKVLVVVDTISAEDIEFNALHGKQIMDVVFEEVVKHNEPNNHSAFTLTPQFTATLAIHVACIALREFERMNLRFIERHGVRARLRAYKDRVFLRFKNYVNRATAEVTAAEDFCEILKMKIKQLVLQSLDGSVQDLIIRSVGQTKHELIVAMLDEIAEKENFAMFHDYTNQPLVYCTDWLRCRGDGLLFENKDQITEYGKLAQKEIDDIMRHIRESAQAASDSTDIVSTEQKFTMWGLTFCDSMGDVLALTPDLLQPGSECVISNFESYQQILEGSLQKMEDKMKEEFESVTGDNMKWFNVLNPYERVRNRLWGCTEQCPFCEEPCQFSDPRHNGTHSCIQHRPSGICGTRDRDSSELQLEPCSFKVANKKAIFNCESASKQCRASGHCKALGGDMMEHNFREYKKYLPNWDIAPDPSGEASKYWKWIVVRFQTQLLEMHQGTKLTIPKSWTRITKEEARESLNQLA